MKQLTEIETHKEYRNPSQKINMLDKAQDRAILLRDEKYEIGTRVILMQSGLVKVIATKTSEFAVEMRVQLQYDGRRFKKSNCTTHEVMGEIIRLQEKLVDFS